MADFMILHKPSVGDSKILSRRCGNAGIRSSSCVVLDVQLSMYQIASEFIQKFLIEGVTDVHPSMQTFIPINFRVYDCYDTIKNNSLFPFCQAIFLKFDNFIKLKLYNFYRVKLQPLGLNLSQVFLCNVNEIHN